MKLDRAPYELTSMPITLQPLQFPHSRKLQTGVKLASPTAQSKVSSTQSELAYVEQALKLSMHAISNTMYYTDFGKVKQREDMQPDRQDSEHQDTEVDAVADLNAAITDTQLDRRTARSGGLIGHCRR